MKLKNIYALLILVMALFIAPAHAQTKKAGKKTVKKTAAKKPAPKKAAAKLVKKKPAPKPAAVINKSAAQKLGEAVANAAQDTTKKAPDLNNSSLSEEIIVTTAYKPVLADAVKIRRNPDLEDKSPFKAPLSYAPLDKRLERNTDIKQMEAVKLPPETDSTLYNNLVKVGAGNLKTTYGELYINNGRDAALQAGLYAKHFAQSGTALASQNQSTDEIGIFGKSVGATNSLHGSIDYKHQSSYFYGYDATATPVLKPNATQQTFNTITAEGELTKNYKDVERDFTYALKASGYLFSNAFKGKENNVVVSGFINQTVKQFYAGLNSSIDISTQQDSAYSINNTLVRANPYLKFQGDNYKIDAGVNIVSELGFSTRFFIFPAARLEVQVIPKYVRLFAEAKGDVDKSSIRDFSETNPFVGQNIAIKNSVDQLDLAAGLKGTLAPGIGFKATVYRNQIKNMPLFISNFNLANSNNRFSVIYDGGNAKVNGFNGELDFKISDDVDVFGRVEFKDYSMATEAQPWNLPKFKLTAGTNINISDKVKLHGALLFRGNTYDRVDITNPLAVPAVKQTQVISLASFADVNAGAEYKVNRHVGIFVQANNLLNITYSQWLYYPNYGFNIMGGLSYGF
jgi:hypothetical protein